MSADLTADLTAKRATAATTVDPTEAIGAAVPLLALEGVSKGYGEPGQRSEVLSEVNLTVNQGEFVAIVGYSGAGKTTLISMLAGLLTPDRGRALMAGQVINGPGPERGVVFQNYS